MLSKQYPTRPDAGISCRLATESDKYFWWFPCHRLPAVCRIWAVWQVGQKQRRVSHFTPSQSFIFSPLFKLLRCMSVLLSKYSSSSLSKQRLSKRFSVNRASDTLSLMFPVIEAAMKVAYVASQSSEEGSPTAGSPHASTRKSPWLSPFAHGA